MMEDDTHVTDKDVLVKGIKTMGLCAVFMFLGPTLAYIALGNQEKLLFIPLLILAFAICAFAIYLGFKGLKTIMDSMFMRKQ